MSFYTLIILQNSKWGVLESKESGSENNHMHF